MILEPARVAAEDTGWFDETTSVEEGLAALVSYAENDLSIPRVGLHIGINDILDGRYLDGSVTKEEFGTKIERQAGHFFVTQALKKPPQRTAYERWLLKLCVFLGVKKGQLTVDNVAGRILIAYANAQITARSRRRIWLAVKLVCATLVGWGIASWQLS